MPNLSLPLQLQSNAKAQFKLV
jgi:hypothetical protein